MKKQLIIALMALILVPMVGQAALKKGVGFITHFNNRSPYTVFMTASYAKDIKSLDKKTITKGPQSVTEPQPVKIPANVEGNADFSYDDTFTKEHKYARLDIAVGDLKNMKTIAKGWVIREINDKIININIEKDGTIALDSKNHNVAKELSDSISRFRSWGMPQSPPPVLR